MLEKLKDRVYRQNILLVKHGLVVLTWGNVSAIDREHNLVVIKPSGVDYDAMTADDMVVVDLDGNVVQGEKRPSSDTPTHLYLYKTFADVGGIVHTHSTYATAWAQSGRSIPPYGTTHADFAFGDIPVTRSLTKAETEIDYESNTGKVIAEAFRDNDISRLPAVLVKNHGPYVWGDTPEKAVQNAVVLEEVAKIAALTEAIGGKENRVDDALLKKHFDRKHGANAYYGQPQSCGIREN